MRATGEGLAAECAAGAAGRPRALPGDAAWWIFVTAEFTTLCMFFVACAFAWRDDPAGFGAAQAGLDPAVGFANALILISSGYCAARGVGAAQREAFGAAARWLAVAALLGLGFVLVKAIEYEDKLSAGIHLSTHTFWFFYFFLTGFHFLHVLFGLGFLAVMAWQARWIGRGGAACAPRPTRAQVRTGIESAAVFWHMLDLVWVILLPLLYLR
jgi:nitric oxide reductase NorE protein